MVSLPVTFLSIIFCENNEKKNGTFAVLCIGADVKSVFRSWCEINQLRNLNIYLSKHYFYYRKEKKIHDDQKFPHFYHNLHNLHNLNES